jgi:tetratricopeptide (TPR) repeat protein
MLARSGHETEALPYFRAGFALAQQAGGPVALGLASLAMAAIDREGTAYLQHYERATALFRQAQDDELLAMALYFQGDDQRMQGAVTGARASYLESLQLYRRMGNQLYLAYPLGNLGRLALLEGDTAAARRAFAECVTYSRRNGNGISLVDWLIRLGTVAVYDGDSSAARAAFEEAVTLARDLDYQTSIPQIHAWLALAEGMAGNLQRAMAHLEQGVEGYLKGITAAERPQHSHLDLSRSEVLGALFAAAYLHHAGGRPGAALVIVSGIEQVAQAQGYRLDLPLQAMVEAVRSTSEAALSPAGYQLLWQEGQAMTVEQLLRRSQRAAPVQ